MIPIDLSGKVALVTGVGDDKSFAWFISKALQAAGARLVLAVHPRMLKIVDGFLTGTGPEDIKSRELPFGAGALTVEKVLPCDVSYDTMADVDPKVRTDRRYVRVEEQFGDYSIEGLMKAVRASHGAIDILIHSVAFSPEIKNKAVDTSRSAYLTALSISAYSLTALLRAATPLMENRPGGAAALGLTYIGGDRVVPHYGGGMSTAKAALQIDAKQLASNLGPKNIRVNLISAGPYASRAATAIADPKEGNSIFKMIDYAASRSPLPRGVTAEEVANTTAFLCSPLASGITGEVVYVDCGYNVMGL
jgi:enoyl-[acyl-carrier protein] reductase I